MPRLMVGHSALSVHFASVRELRELARHRAKLVALRLSVKCLVHAVLAACCSYLGHTNWTLPRGAPRT